MKKKKMIFLDNFDLLPEEVKSKYNVQKYHKLPKHVQDLFIKEELVKWCIAMNYCDLDFKKYLPLFLSQEIYLEILQIKKKANLEIS